MTKVKEIWKDVVGYEGFYQVSNIGRIRSIRSGIILKEYKSEYPIVSLNRLGRAKSFCVHRLMAIAFLPNPENKSQVNHINGDKHDNRLANLEWVTPSENLIHSYKVLGFKSTCCWNGRLGSKNHNSIAVRQYSKDGKPLELFGGCREAARKMGIHPTNISSVCLGKRKMAAGFIWKYENS